MQLNPGDQCPRQTPFLRLFCESENTLIEFGLVEIRGSPFLQSVVDCFVSQVQARPKRANGEFRAAGPFRVGAVRQQRAVCRERDA